MIFTNITDEIEYASKRFILKKDIEEMVLSKNYICYEPSIIEDYDEYITLNSRSNRESTVKVMNANGKISILRPDITSNLLSTLLPRWEHKQKLKIFYYEKIFKQSGMAIKEIRQMGIECLGFEAVDSDKEVIMLANDILKKYRDNYILELGSSEYLNGLLEEFNLNSKEYENILYFLDRKNKQDLKNCIKGFEKNDAYETLVNIFDLKGDLSVILEKASIGFLNKRMKKGLEELNGIFNFMDERDLMRNIIGDLSMVSSLGYYAGVIIKGYFRDSNREIIKGGRYDTFTEKFGSTIPAIGFSVEIDELLKALYNGGEI